MNCKSQTCFFNMSYNFLTQIYLCDDSKLAIKMINIAYVTL